MSGPAVFDYEAIAHAMKPQIGTDEGDRCGREGCNGVIEFAYVGDPPTWFDTDYDDSDFDDGGCSHEEYDLDILTGRAQCDFCDYHWYASDREMQRHADLMEKGYPEPLATHAERVLARMRANTPWSEPAPMDELYSAWEAADTRETMCEGEG